MKLNSIIPALIVLSLGVSLSRCATYSGAESKKNVQKLSVGMGENKVLDLLGTPDSVVKVDDQTDRWIYEYRKEAKKGHNLFVDFKNGIFARSGELNGRDVAAAEEKSTPGSCTQWSNPDYTEQSLCTH